MPELPEVETVRRSLLPLLVGRTITDIRVRDFPGVLGPMDLDSFAALVRDRSIIDIRRRGKYLLIDFDDDGGLIVHLRMTGSLLTMPADVDPVRFEHIVFWLDDGQSLRFADQRKFGRIEYRSPENRSPLEGKLGPEPLSGKFTAAYLASAIVNRKAPIKAMILDQRIVAGVGNIYADEALFRSSIHPLRPAGQLTGQQIASLSARSRPCCGPESRTAGPPFPHTGMAMGRPAQIRGACASTGAAGVANRALVAAGRSLRWLLEGGRVMSACAVSRHRPRPKQPRRNPGCNDRASKVERKITKRVGIRGRFFRATADKGEVLRDLPDHARYAPEPDDQSRHRPLPVRKMKEQLTERGTEDRPVDEVVEVVPPVDRVVQIQRVACNVDQNGSPSNMSRIWGYARLGRERCRIQDPIGTMTMAIG